MESIKDKVAIVGMGCTKFGERWDAGIDDLVIEAAYEAYEDAGHRPQDIQACWYGSVTQPVVGIGCTHLAGPLKLHGIPMTRVENWCTTGHEALRGMPASVLPAACTTWFWRWVWRSSRTQDSPAGNRTRHEPGAGGTAHCPGLVRDDRYPLFLYIRTEP
jgi:hypothetical protein